VIPVNAKDFATEIKSEKAGVAPVEEVVKEQAVAAEEPEPVETPTAATEPEPVVEAEPTEEPELTEVVEHVGGASNNNSELHSGFWHSILELLKSDASVHATLSDSSKVRAELKDNILFVRAGNPFTIAQVESKMISDPLKAAAGKVLGRDVVLRVEIAEFVADESKRDNLDRLMSNFSDVIKVE